MVTKPMQMMQSLSQAASCGGTAICQGMLQGWYAKTCANGQNNSIGAVTEKRLAC